MSPTAMKETMYNDVMVTAVLVSALTQRISNSRYTVSIAYKSYLPMKSFKMRFGQVLQFIRYFYLSGISINHPFPGLLKPGRHSLKN